jgi:tetratricopeptide (TPR) repeat protein
VIAAGPAVTPAGAHADLDIVQSAVAEAVARDPESAEAYLRQAQVQQVAGEWDAALESLEHAARHGADPDSVAAARGRVFLAAGFARMARLELDGVLERRPDLAAVRFERGRAWLALGDTDRAAADFARAVADMEHPTPDHVLACRDAHVKAGRREAALDALDRGMARLGAVASLQLAAIDLELELGHPDRALERVDRLLVTSPSNPAWVARRGEILALAGRPEEARVAFGQALALLEARPGERRGARSAALEHRLRAALGSPVTSSKAVP